ncbi:hypothetical protein [Nocardia terpenica]|uniref:hypothetical protein n=1 Tax=Nocardia terpenica TaxID=455432 RepID=UPI001EEBCDB8|nr:hypothetical protein [Nocardia terpenica]
MRITVLGATLFTTLVGAGCLACGTASAAVPIAQPDQGRIGIDLSHGETAAVADSPLPALFAMAVPMNRIGAGIRGDSTLYRDEHGGVHASLRQVILEAANHGDGTVTVYLNAPGTHGSRVLDVYQRWD